MNNGELRISAILAQTSVALRWYRALRDYSIPPLQADSSIFHYEREVNLLNGITKSITFLKEYKQLKQAVDEGKTPVLAVGLSAIHKAHLAAA